MKCNKCGYDDNGSGDTAHACTFYQSLSQPVETPQRTWVGLTDDEMWNAYTGGSDIINLDYAKAIEARLKEKNK